MDFYEVNQEEQIRRQKLAAKARRMIRENLPVEEEDKTSLTASYRSYFMQVSFSPLHPLMVICLARSIPPSSSMKKWQVVNRLNLMSVLGSHTINEEVGCYSYRSTHWLDTELTLERFLEILNRCVEEASRGYETLKAA